MPAWGRARTPTVRRAWRRGVGEDAERSGLAEPGAPETSAKPPSPASCSTRQQNEFRRVVTCNASVGTLGANGFHLKACTRPASCCSHVVSFVLGEVGGRQSGGGLPVDHSRQERSDPARRRRLA